MKRPPRKPKENIFSNGMGKHILWVGFLMGITTLGIQYWAINSENSHGVIPNLLMILINFFKL